MFQQQVIHNFYNLGITIRNLPKKWLENDIKELLKTKLEGFSKTIKDKEKQEYYEKNKKIKQIKLLLSKLEVGPDDKPKSKVSYID